jgi:hypothetical protein
MKNAFQILDDLEARGLSVWYSQKRGTLLSLDLHVMPADLRHAIGQQIADVTTLVRQHGVRLGYYRLRVGGVWHTVLNRLGYLETACGIALVDRRSPQLSPELPRHQLFCQRCTDRHIARELARIPMTAPNDARSRGRTP